MLSVESKYYTKTIFPKVGDTGKRFDNIKYCNKDYFQKEDDGDERFRNSGWVFMPIQEENQRRSARRLLSVALIMIKSYFT